MSERYAWGWSDRELSAPHVYEIDDYKKFPVTYSVAVAQKLDNFRVIVGENMTRTFTIDTLPDEIKSALAMIHAVGLTESMYARQSGGALEHVGWYVGTSGLPSNEYAYKVIITAGLLDRLQGK